MAGLEDILANLPLDGLAQQLGANPQEVQQAAASALPAILGGLQANATDQQGEASILEALTQHSPDLADNVDLNQINVADGEKIAGHIFGANQDQVIQQLGGVGGAGSSLIKKLLPILAPIVMSYIVKQMTNRGAAPAQQTAGGSLGDSVLGQVLNGALQGAGGQQQQGSGNILGDLLGGLLGGGRR